MIIAILSNNFSSKTPLHSFLKEVLTNANSWETLVKEVFIHVYSWAPKCYKLASINKEIFYDLCKVNTGLIDICTPES